MRYILAVFSCIICVIGCTESIQDIGDLEVGEDFVNSDIRIIVLDTFTVAISNIKFDSIVSSDTERLLVGRYEDDLFGTVEANSYFELSTINFELPSNAELDSTVLILGYDRYFYNDTTQLSTLYVHELTDELKPEEDDFYNTSTIGFDSVPLASEIFFPEPFDEDSVHIKLPLQFGQNIFTLIQENDINDNDDLKDEFKGFTLRPGNNDNAAIVGFSQSEFRSYLRFYYSIPSEFEDQEDYYDLRIEPFNGVTVAYNQIISDASQTPLGVLDDQEKELATENTSDLGYIQSGTGFAVKVRFPFLKKINEIPGTGTVLQATLKLKPPTETYDDLRPLSDSLNVQVIDINNDMPEELRNGEGLVLGRITGEKEEFADVVYEIPIGVFIDRKLNESPETEDALLLTANGFNESVNRLVIQGGQSDDFPARLEITYAIYDE